MEDGAPLEIKVNVIKFYVRLMEDDVRSGVDQRAPVGLLTRNVKIQGEVGTKCQYALTRESLRPVFTLI